MSGDLKAYQVREDGEGHCVIVFATNGATARREGGNELDLSFEEVDSCTRAPWADEFAPGPVPLHAYLANGWWFECDHCGAHFDEDERNHGEDDREDELEPVEDSDGRYCSPTCRMEHWSERRSLAARKAAAIEAALISWPMATGVTADEYYDYPSRDHETRARFTLPGLSYPVSWVPGAKTVSVSQCDVDEFKRLYGIKESA